MNAFVMVKAKELPQIRGDQSWLAVQYLVSWPAPPSLHIAVYAFELLQQALLGDLRVCPQG